MDRRVSALLPRLLIGLLLVSASAWAANDALVSLASAAPETVTFHCSIDPSCPEIMIGGDPFATLGGSPAPFRGYGDPSLEHDPSTDTLWLSYSWLDVLVSDPGPPAQIDFGVRTHLARSDDGGATFTFVRSVNETTTEVHPDTGAPGWFTHEISTLVREGPGAWQLLWLTYFDPFGESPGDPDDRSDFHYRRSLASTPEVLGDTSEPWIRGSATSPSFGAPHNLSLLPQLSDCGVFTEPALFSYGGETYLATGCVVILSGVRRDDLDRVVLLRQGTNGYSYVGELLDYDDAVDLGADRLEQANLALSRTGEILLIATPIKNDSDPQHQGCVVYEVTDLMTAQVRRDAAGSAVQLARITADGNGLGPGLCTYSPESDTGVLLVITTLDLQSDPIDIVFSLRATGVHPSGLAVGGRAEPADPQAVRPSGTDSNHASRPVLAVGLALAALIAESGLWWLIVRRRRVGPG